MFEGRVWKDRHPPGPHKLAGDGADVNAHLDTFESSC